MRPVRVRPNKVTVNIDALVEFLTAFRPKTMIAALVELCEFATTHPDYDREFSSLNTWLEADIATDLLMDFFQLEHDEPFEVDELPVVTVNPSQGTITIRWTPPDAGPEGPPEPPPSTDDQPPPSGGPPGGPGGPFDGPIMLPPNWPDLIPPPESPRAIRGPIRRRMRGP